jgi:hypothetical protein
MVAVRGVARYGRFAANNRNAARGSVWVHSTSRITNDKHIRRIGAPQAERLSAQGHACPVTGRRHPVAALRVEVL